MGDMLQSMAPEISRNNGNNKMWDKGEIIIILSRTKISKSTICVGYVNDTLTALKDLLTKNTQWADYMEEIIRIVTINYDGDT